MPKHTTLKLQETIMAIGHSLGFAAEMEYRFPMLDAGSGYAPVYDVVWFAAPGDAPAKALRKLGVDPQWASSLTRLPVAVFEIEGATTSSKNQVGNCLNLLSAPAPFKFMIVDNAHAGNEHDTYRRAVKIARTMTTFHGDRSLVVCDAVHLEGLLEGEAFKPRERSIAFPQPPFNPEGGGRGGEKQSREIFKRLLPVLLESGLTLRPDAAPPQFAWRREAEEIRITTGDDPVRAGRSCTWDPVSGEQRAIKNLGDYFYVPRIDVTLTFQLPVAFTRFLDALGEKLGPDAGLYPLLDHAAAQSEEALVFPLAGIEIETGGSKHAHGGMLNASRFFFVGIVAGEPALRPHYTAIRSRLGLGNLFFYGI